MSFGITDAELMAQIEELRDLPDEEIDQLFDDETNELSDGHLVEYLEECVKHCERTEDKRMKLDEMLWNAHEGEMPELNQKEDWQAKMTTNEPFQTVIQAKMLVRKAIVDQPEWINATTEQTDNPYAMAKADFWQDSLRWWMTRTKATHSFPDMTEMAFAIGTSLAMKGIWSKDSNGIEGLRWARLMPWQIRRDPEAMSRDAQSGLFCIHQDYVPYHVLLEGEKKGFYENVRGSLRDKGDEGSWDRRSDQRKRGLVDYSHRFNPQVFVREFWGGVLDHNGELVYPNVRFTVANRTVIKRPVPTKFARIRWPIYQFSALPHLRNFHGYSLIEGMLKMWKFRCNLLSMTVDKLNFIMNGAYEVDTSKLLDPQDTELYPGCTKKKKAGAQGSAYNEIPISGDFLQVFQAMMAETGNLFQNGVFVTELLKGESGDRKNITKGEVEIKTQQAMGVFEGIGRDVEYGAEGWIEMAQDILTTYWDPNDNPSYLQVLGVKHQALLEQISMLSPEERMKAVREDTEIKIRGVSLLFAKSALVDRLINMVKITDSPRFQPFSKDDVLIRKLGDTMDVSEAIKSEEEMQAEMAQKQAEMAAMAGQGMPASPEVMGGGAPDQPAVSGDQMAEQALAAAGMAEGAV